jgi:hypothetical protein
VNKLYQVQKEDHAEVMSGAFLTTDKMVKEPAKITSPNESLLSYSIKISLLGGPMAGKKSMAHSLQEMVAPHKITLFEINEVIREAL